MNVEKVVIRPARLEDVPSIQKIYGHYVETTPASFEEVAPTLEETTRRFLEGHVVYPWLVAEVSGAVVGFAYAGPHKSRASYRWAVDTTVYLATDARSHGLGRRLYNVLLPILRRQGFFQAYAGIAQPNPASVALHESFGFVRVGIYENVGFKFGRWHTVWWLGLPLQGASEPVTEPIRFADL